jgi:hypothetical protein
MRLISVVNMVMGIVRISIYLQRVLGVEFIKEQKMFYSMMLNM